MDTVNNTLLQSISEVTTSLMGLTPEDYTALPDDMMSQDPFLTTETTFLKPNMTIKKFFNISIPIDDKINLGILGINQKQNLTDKINEVS